MSQITVWKAVVLSALHTVLFVGFLYVREASRPSPTKSKDFPSVIKARFAALTVAFLISVFGNRWIIEQARQSGQRTGIPVWDRILGGWGEWNIDIIRTLQSLGLTALLFLGPLVERIWISGGWKRIASRCVEAGTSLIGWRNYIVGPASEEIVFRGCIIPLFLMARVPVLTIIFTTPLFFGLAHIHHAYEFNLHHPLSYGQTIFVTLVQLTYTTIFGWYASYLLIVTRTIWAPIVVHTFCNIMGLPRFFGMIPGVPRWQSVLYYTCLVLGLVGFVRNIGVIKPDEIVV